MTKYWMLVGAAGVALLFALAPMHLAQDETEDDEKKTEAADEREVDYLVITADGLEDIAHQWAAYRGDHGRVAKVLTISEIAGEYGGKQIGVTEIKSRIVKESGGAEPREGFQVLLLGDCPDEDAGGYDKQSQIPWFLTRQMDANPTESRRKRIPTDNFYADTVKDDDMLPDIAVGRIPARTVEQARMALNKVKAYESAAQGEWLRNLTFFAGEGRFGAAIDKMLEKLFITFAEQTIDQAYNVRMTYANINSEYAYVPRKFSEKVIEEANRGALVLTYLGHGLYDRLDNMYVEVEGKRVRYPILTSEDVGKFDIPDGKLPVMLIIACQTGYMDHKEGCLAETICFTEKAPVAVIASSRDSHPYSNTILQKGVIQQMTDTRAPTLGEAFLNAKRELILAEDPDRGQLEFMAMLVIPDKKERDQLNRSHLSLYNLTGDPGLRMQYPKLDFDLAVGNTFKAGGDLVPGIRADDVFWKFDADGVHGDFEFWIEVERPEHANEIKEFDKSALAGTDEDARAKAEKVIAGNHANANDKKVGALEMKAIGTTARKGRNGEELIFEGKLDPGLEPGDYILKVFARDPEGERCGFAAARIKVNK